MAVAIRPPGPKGHFLSGNSPEYNRHPLGFLTRCAREYGDIVGLRFGRQHVLLLNHPDHVEHVLITRHRNFPKYSRRFVSPVFGNGLFASEGDFWLRQRRLLQPAFQRQRLARHAEAVVALTERAAATWQDGETRDLHAEMMRLMLQIAAKTILGIDLPEEAHDFGCALEAALQPGSGWSRWLPRVLPTPSRRRQRQALYRLDAVLYRLIEQPRARDDDRDDLLSSLLRDRLEHPDSHMTDRQLRDEAMNVFIAGRETTALALAWSWHLLAGHARAMAELEKELQAVLGGRAPTVADLPQLRYTERVVLESLRLFPPAYKLGRVAIEDCEIGGYDVPAGTPLLLMPWVLHRDPRYFDDPDQFQPNRWADGLAQRLPKCTYFPFGAGPRLCIGNTFAMMNAVLVLATIAQEFRVRPAPGHAVTLWPAVTLRPGNGIQAVLKARRRTAAVSATGTSVHARTRPRISMCMVVKNEADNLPSCLGSVAHLVDEIVVADTGSTDNTKAVAASFGARVVDFPWCDDCAAARNESQRHATGAWIFYLDGDERLDTDNQQRLRDLFAGLKDENAAYTLQPLSRPRAPTGIAMLATTVRLFRNDSRLRWKYRAHPQITPALSQYGAEVRHTRIVIEHSGYQDDNLVASKLKRRLRYMQLDNAQYPDDPYILFNLGFCHLDLGRAAEAVPFLQRSLELADPRVAFFRKLFPLLARAQSRLGQRAEALATLETGLARFADDAELLFTKGVLLAEAGNFPGAEACLVQLLRSGEVPDFAFVHPGLRGYLGRHYLAGVYCAQDRLADAEAEWTKALADWPNFTPAWRGLGELYAAQARWDDFAKVIERMRADPQSRLDAEVLQAQGYLAREEFSAARDTLEAVIAAAPQAPWPREVLSRVLLRQGEEQAVVSSS